MSGGRGNLKGEERLVIDYSFVEACAGAVGGLCATTLLYPLDLAKTKYQADSKAQRKSTEDEETAGLAEEDYNAQVEASKRDGKNGANCTAKDEAPGKFQQRYHGLWDAGVQTVRENGVLGLYEGLALKNVSSVITQFIYFYAYSYFKEQYAKRSGRKVGTAVNLVLAAAAGACVVLVTQPLDTVNARMQTGLHKEEDGSKDGESLFDIFRRMGFKRAYKGLGASLFLTCNPAIQYTVFDQTMKQIVESQKHPAGGASKGGQLSALAAFVLGAWSKTVATVMTYPAIRCKVMQQAGKQEQNATVSSDGIGLSVAARASSILGPNGGPPAGSIFGIIRRVLDTEGPLGFYKGMGGQILKTVLTAAIMLMIKEEVYNYCLAMAVSVARWRQRQQKQALLLKVR